MNKIMILLVALVFTSSPAFAFLPIWALKQEIHLVGR